MVKLMQPCVLITLISFAGFNSPEWFLSDIGAIFAGGKVKTKEFYDFVMVKIIFKNKEILDSARLVYFWSRFLEMQAEIFF